MSGIRSFFSPPPLPALYQLFYPSSTCFEVTAPVCHAPSLFKLPFPVRCALFFPLNPQACSDLEPMCARPLFRPFGVRAFFCAFCLVYYLLSFFLLFLRCVSPKPRTRLYPTAFCLPGPAPEDDCPSPLLPFAGFPFSPPIRNSSLFVACTLPPNDCRPPLIIRVPSSLFFSERFQLSFPCWAQIFMIIAFPPHYC